MSESSSNKDQSKEDSIGHEQMTNSDNLENLLRQLHGQIRTSDWLEKNTAVKLENENPELVKAWKEAVNEEND